MKLQKNYYLLLAVFLASCATPPPFDVKESTKTAYTLKDTFEQAAEFLPLVEAGTGESCRKELGGAAQELRVTTDRATVTLARLEQQFFAPYHAFRSTSDFGLLVAVRHRPFLDEIPANLQIQMTDGAHVITKTGGTESYHVCVNHQLKEGACFAIKFRLTTQGSGGGTPVPYFGVRDARGQEEVLVLFSSYPKPEETHEILLFRKGHVFAALYDGRIKTVRLRATGDPIYPFFHMNDRSSVVLTEVRLPPSATSEKAANNTSDGIRQPADGSPKPSM